VNRQIDHLLNRLQRFRANESITRRLTFHSLSGRLEKEKATLPCLKKTGRYDA
jgi:hypothetical protein